MSVRAVADAGPLIHLGEIGSLDLLDVLDHLYVPETVRRELAEGGIPDGMDRLSYESVAVGQSSEMASELDPGETAALTLAVEHDAVLLTDDMAARDAATDAGVEVHGSLGVIALAYNRDRLDRNEAADCMRALQRETSLFVSDAVGERGTELLDEQ